MPVCSVGCCGRRESLLGGVEGSQDAVVSGTALQHIPGEGAQSSLPLAMEVPRKTGPMVGNAWTLEAWTLVRGVKRISVWS